MKLTLTKSHGCGNDFVLLHAKDVRDMLLGAKKRQESEEERADKYAKAAARIAKRLGGITKKELKENGN